MLEDLKWLRACLKMWWRNFQPTFGEVTFVIFALNVSWEENERIFKHI